MLLLLLLIIEIILNVFILNNLICYLYNFWLFLSRTQQAAHCSKDKARNGRGNVHTGATPPWLRDDEDEADVDGVNVGPSEEEFIKHSQENVYNL